MNEKQNCAIYRRQDGRDFFRWHKSEEIVKKHNRGKNITTKSWKIITDVLIFVKCYV